MASSIHANTSHSMLSEGEPERSPPSSPPPSRCRHRTSDGNDAAPQCGLPSCAAEGTKRCQSCNAMHYCSKDHQRSHWKVHKVECRGGKAKGASAGGGGAAAGAPRVKNAGEAGGDARGSLSAAGGVAESGKDRDPARSADRHVAGGATADSWLGLNACWGFDHRTADRHVGQTTRARHEMLRGHMMGEDDFDIHVSPIGARRWPALLFALGSEGEPYDDDAAKLALGAPGLDVNERDEGGRSALWCQCSMGRSRNVALLLADARVDPNLADSDGYTPLYIAANLGEDRCVAHLLADRRLNVNQADSPGKQTPLSIAANQGHDRGVELLLSDPRVNVNQANLEGHTPLYTAVHLGEIRCVELCLAHPRVDVNQADANGNTPLHVAANLGNIACLELLLADERIDVCRTNATGQTPLSHACYEMRESIGKIGAHDNADPARGLVLILRSRRVTDQCLRDTIADWDMPTDRDIARAEYGIEPLSRDQRTARMVIPVLVAQLKGERRWCAYCLKLTLDKDIDLCSQCHQVGYCRPLTKMQLRRMPHEEQERRRKLHCQTLHWKAEGGHKKDCKRWAKEKAEAEEGKARGEEEEDDDEERSIQGGVDGRSVREGGGRGGHSFLSSAPHSRGYSSAPSRTRRLAPRSAWPSREAATTENNTDNNMEGKVGGGNAGAAGRGEEEGKKKKKGKKRGAGR